MYTSGNLRKNSSPGYCVQTALNTSFAILSQLENRRQLCVCFDFYLWEIRVVSTDENLQK